MKRITAIVSFVLLLSPALLGADGILLEIPYYSQGKDSPWAEESLGDGTTMTIRTHGCALTSISMVVSYFTGKNMNPSRMNRWLSRNNGFEEAWEGKTYMGRVLLNWPVLTGFDTGWVYTRFDWRALPADLILIKCYLDRGIPVIAEVVYRNAPHYIVITGYGDEGFLMNDPEFPDEHHLNRVYNISDEYGSGAARNIYGIRVLYPQYLCGEEE